MPPRSFFDDANDITSVIEWSDLDHSASSGENDDCGFVATATTSLPLTSQVEQEDDHQAPSKRQRVRGVTFAPSKTLENVTEVLHIKDYSWEERNACWFNRHDMKFFKKDAKVGATLWMMGGLEHDTKDYCKRGLEWRTPEGSKKRRQTRLNAIVAVLKEQEEMLDDLGYVADEELAQVYHNFTIQSRIEATTRGVMDARDV